MIASDLRSDLMAKVSGFRKDRGGAAAILFAFAMPMLIGVLGLGFEVSNWYLTQRAMQNAADAAVLAAISNSGTNSDTEAKAVATLYGFTAGVTGQYGLTTAVTATKNIACPAGGTTCYGVTISGSVPLYLSPAVGYAGSGGTGRQNLSAAATAARLTTPRSYCILALGANGITATSASGASFVGCNIKSNTTANCGSYDLNADNGDAVGTNTGCGNVATSNVAASTDPYAALASNIPANPCGGSYPQGTGSTVTKWTGNKTLSGSVPTQVCGDLLLTGDVMITSPAAGAVLVLWNGELNTANRKFRTSSGSGLTVVFAGTSGTYAHVPTGGGDLDITAPTSGVWSGIALYQAPNLTTGVDIDTDSTSSVKISGLAYLPNSDVTYRVVIGKSTYGQACFAMVVQTLAVTGSGGISSTGACAAAGLTLPTGDVDAGRGKLVN
jgi:Flp pilus assembly protein TadG